MDPKRTAVVQAGGDPTVFIRGIELTPGMEVSIAGKRGRFRYLRASVTADGAIALDFIGGTRGRELWHSFYPDRVRKVHKVTTLRTWPTRNKQR